ncbi:MAG: Gfo/Idh/MocA family oxidoreductase [Candidatus Omnitrophica bacterium]|nr:Gfo/Idh/MocA family oxidoreductase [Candidatus Omnitrophota bacterium]
MNYRLERRSFLKSAAAAGAFLSAPGILARAQGQKFRTATIGAGWWGLNITRYAMQSGETRIVALCDVDWSDRKLDKVHQDAMGSSFDGTKPYLEQARDLVEKLSGDQPTLYTDFREMLEKEKPEIVIVGAPDHWHALATIAAVQAGAHVYVEKPVSHTINEGVAMVKAAREADRVVQVGTHRRVGVHNKTALEFLRSGKAGKIGMCRAFVHYAGGPGEPAPDSEPPQGLDWDMWCGPAPLRPFNPRMHPEGFRQFLDYANGQLGDWGIHWMDQILWWTEEKYPKKISSAGGRRIKQDNTDAPDTQVVTFEFDSFTATWEHRQYGANHAEKHNIGIYFYGTNGTFHLGWLDGWTFYPNSDRDPLIHEDCVFDNADKENIRELWADFLDSIKNAKRPVCDIEIGHRSTNMSLLGMLSLKLGRSLVWDGEKEKVIGDEQANQLLSREYRAPWTYPEV